MNAPAHGRMVMVRRQNPAAVNATTAGQTGSSVDATVGDDVVAHRNITEAMAGGSPYNIAAALANFQHSNNVMLPQKAKRGEGEVKAASTTDVEEDCEVEEEQEANDDEECEKEDSNDAEEEDCNDNEGEKELPNFTAQPESGSSAFTPSDL